MRLASLALSATAAALVVCSLPQAEAALPTAAEISALCAKPVTSMWEKHLCAQVGKVQPGCLPQRRFAYGNRNATNIKGAVLIFHGYTACPDAMEGLAEAFEKAGYLAYIPLNPGHGLPRGSCDPSKRPGAVCVDGYPIDQLPTSKEPYLDFASWSVAMIREELAALAKPGSRAPTFTVATAGLSLGGPLATMASFYGKGLFSRAVLVNPFLSVAAQALDFAILDCKKSANPDACINAFVNGLVNLDKIFQVGQNVGTGNVGVGNLFQSFANDALKQAQMAVGKTFGGLLLNRYDEFVRFITNRLLDAEANPAIRNSTIFSNPFGWGAGCIANADRPGYCSFQVRNLLAINALGMHAVSRSSKITNMRIAVMGTQRDGYMRNGVIYSTASSFALAPGNAVSMCMYRAADGCTDLMSDNRCGVPHSSFSRIENTRTAPNSLYWEADMFANILGFVGGSKSTIGSVGGASGPAVCAPLTLNNRALYSTELIAGGGGNIVADAKARWSA